METVTPGIPSRSRIWIITELYYPELTSTGYFLTRIAEGLAADHPISVLCGQPTYAARGIRAPSREVRANVTIVRCPSTTLNKDVLPFRLINLISFTISIFFQALRRLDPGSLVLVVTNPPLLPFVVAAACRIRRCRCVLVVHDVYPEILVSSGLLGENHLLVRLLHRLNRWLFRRLRCLVVLGNDMRSVMVSKLNNLQREVVIIPNWSDLDEIHPQPRRENTLLRELHLSDQFVVQYSGNMGRTHDLESVIECARRLRAHAGIHFLLIGEGAKRPWLEETIRREALPNATLLPYQPRERLAVSLNACDLAIIPQTSRMYGLSVPSRLYNVLAAGKPILAGTERESELGHTVETEKIGWVIPPENPEGLLQAILAAREGPDQLLEMGRRARQLAEREYSFSRVITDYERLIENLEIVNQ